MEAWGDRYLDHNRGNLCQKDWKEVADAVNGRQDGVKPRKTYVQCKNRIDTLKKKYKPEKSKPTPSSWPFYTRLDYLIGAGVALGGKKFEAAAQRKSAVVTFTVKAGKDKISPSPNHIPNVVVYSGGSSSKSRLHSAGSTKSSRGGGLDDGDDEDVVFDGRITNGFDGFDGWSGV